jgi:hypothetical protein
MRHSQYLKGEKPLPPQATATGSEIQSSISNIVRRVEFLEKRVNEIGKVLSLLEKGLDRRFCFEDYRCIYMDGDGYCTAFYFKMPVEGFMLREVIGMRRGTTSTSRCISMSMLYAQDTYQNILQIL